MRDAAIILARFPGPVRLQLSFMRRIAGLVVCFGFLAFSAYLLVNPRGDGWFLSIWYHNAMTWLAFALFAGLSVRAVVLLLAPGGARLTLDADGFTSSTVFWHARTRWRDASNFRVVEIDDARPPLVRYDLIVRGETGRGAMETGDLPHDYSLDIHNLARLMNEWRRRAVERQRSQA
jgi:hypothetical protein